MKVPATPLNGAPLLGMFTRERVNTPRKEMKNYIAQFLLHIDSIG
jgi:hypothetical protein